MGWKKNPPDTSGGLRGSKSVNLILNFAFVFRKRTNLRSDSTEAPLPRDAANSVWRVSLD
jgi:hypothetical protein